jgi:nitrate reductase NapE component
MEDSDHDDHDISDRLAALEARVPAPAMPRALPPRRRRGRIALSIAMAPVLALALVASATGAIVVSNLVKGYPGIQNPGQPLAGAHMECMTPPAAAAFLAEHGFSVVDWQVEAGDPHAKGADGQIATTSVHQAVPPEHGFVIPGSLLDDGTVIMVIDQRVGTTGVGDCYGAPMP